MFYAPASGGVRTYLEAKHRRLQLYSGVRHSIRYRAVITATTTGFTGFQRPSCRLARATVFPFGVRPAQPAALTAPGSDRGWRPYMTAWAALDAGRRLNVPVIGFYHSDLPLLVSNRIGSWLGTNLNGYVSRLYGSFDRVLAPSEVMADKLIHLGVKNVFVQPLGVDRHLLPPASRPGGAPGARPGGRHAADDLRRARLAEKNLHILLETARQLGKPYHLLLVGSSMPQRVPDNVTVIDRFCPASEVARFMASSDVLLHAGNQETFGPVALEAMACGIPVVAARAGALPELVPFYSGRLCRPLDARAMAHTVRELFEDDPRLLGQQARQHVEAHHAWDAVVAGLLAHYHAVLGTAELPVAVHG